MSNKFLRNLAQNLENKVDFMPAILEFSKTVSEIKFTLLICSFLNHHKQLPNINDFVDHLRDEELLDESLLIKHLDKNLQESLQLSSTAKAKYPPFIVPFPWLLQESNWLAILNKKIEVLDLNHPGYCASDLYIFINHILKQIQPLKTTHGFPHFFPCTKNAIVKTTSEIRALFCSKALFMIGHWISKDYISYSQVIHILSRYCSTTYIKYPLNPNLMLNQTGFPDPSLDPNNFELYYLGHNKELDDLLKDKENDEYLDPSNPDDMKEMTARNEKITHCQKVLISQQQAPIKLYMAFVQAILLTCPMNIIHKLPLDYLLHFSPIYHLYCCRCTGHSYIANIDGTAYTTPSNDTYSPSSVSQIATTPILFELYKDCSDEAILKQLRPHLICYPQYSHLLYDKYSQHSISMTQMDPLSQLACQCHSHLFKKALKGLVNQKSKQWDLVNHLLHAHQYFHFIFYEHLQVIEQLSNFSYQFLQGNDHYYSLIFHSCTQFWLSIKDNRQSINKFLCYLLHKTCILDSKFFNFIHLHFNESSIDLLTLLFTDLFNCTDTTYKQIFYPLLTRLPNLRYIIYTQAHLFSSTSTEYRSLESLLSMYLSIPAKVFAELIDQLLNYIDHSPSIQSIDKGWITLQHLITWLLFHGYTLPKNQHIMMVHFNQIQDIDPLNKYTVDSFNDLLQSFLNKHTFNDYLTSRIEQDKQLFTNVKSSKKQKKVNNRLEYASIFNINDAYYTEYNFDIANAEFKTDCENMAIGCHFKDIDKVLELMPSCIREMMHVLITMIPRLNQSELKKCTLILNTTPQSILQNRVFERIKQRVIELGCPIDLMHKWRTEIKNEDFVSGDEEGELKRKQSDSERETKRIKHE